MKYKIGSYNGWNGDERLAVLPILRAAIAAGELASPTTCSICLVAGTPDRRAESAVWFHDEDYANPMGAYAICRRCHRLLHLRFHDPDTWTAHAALHARGGAWFEKLSMDPASKTRSFAQTYPEGLPGAFEP